MPEITLTKWISRDGSVFVPASDKDCITAEKLGDGEMLVAEVFSGNSGRFHRFFMAMLRYGHERYMEQNAHRIGEETVLMSFDSFRKQVLILAGFCRQVFDLDGTFTIEAESLKYSKMDDERKRDVYDKCVNVVLRLICKDQTREDLDNVVGEFVSNFG